MPAPKVPPACQQDVAAAASLEMVTWVELLNIVSFSLCKSSMELDKHHDLRYEYCFYDMGN